MVKKVNESKDFKYIEAINNRTKHTVNIANKLAMGILEVIILQRLELFFRKNEQHDRVELDEQLKQTNQFMLDIWDEFISVFKEEYKKDKFIENRRHSITGVRQQICEDDPKQNLSYAYIKVEDNFDAMPEKIYLLLVKEDDNQIYGNESTFDNILVTERQIQIYLEDIKMIKILEMIICFIIEHMLRINQQQGHNVYMKNKRKI